MKVLTYKERILETLKSHQEHTIDDIYDEGYYNGIELALSLLENREAKYRWNVRNDIK
jgi:hypothetical protein